MSENKFGRTSGVCLSAENQGGQTVLKDVSFTAPYKIMTPFVRPGGGVSVMPLCASAGIMEGDCQEFKIHVGPGADLEMLSQSFEKIHRMKEGKATRYLYASVSKNAVLYYYPQPVIPYRDSAFESRMEIHLEDESARFFMLEIITCGRNASQERFAYRSFWSGVMIYRGEKLIYRDNTRYIPSKMDMEELGFYEGFSHVANIFLGGVNSGMQEKIWEILERENECEGGVTRLADGDLAVRIFGNRAQDLQKLAEKIKEIF